MQNQYDTIYEEIASEMETGKTEKGLWTRLFAECNGDEQQTKVLYIKQRAEKLISAERARLEQEASDRAAEAERIEKLRPPPSDTQQMEEYGITFDGERYAYREYKYDRLSDAISYAKLQTKVAPIAKLAKGPFTTGVQQDIAMASKCHSNTAASAAMPSDYEAIQQEKLASSAPSPTYAGFWFRALALVIDGVLCQIIAVIVVLPLAFALGLSMEGTSSTTEIEAVGSGLGFFIGILVQWLWFTIPESSKWQATVGKKILGLKVTDENGERIGFGKANGRYWSKILSALILGIGFVMVAFTEKKQGLHDKMAGTLVVKTNA